MKLTLPRALLILAALAAALAGFYVARQIDRTSPQLASGTWFPQGWQLADFRLTDSAGQDYTLARLTGAPTLVFFGFTHCPDVCPTTLLRLAQVRKAAGIPDLRVLFVSIDPQRDTPEVIGRYVHAFDPQFEGVTGTPEAIGALARRFNVAVNRVELPGGDYTMDHSAVVFLLDAGARVVAIFTPPFDTKLMVADLQASAPYLKGRR
jgi:protein SCO1/2